jgi:hypothetical protein
MIEVCAPVTLLEVSMTSQYRIQREVSLTESASVELDCQANDLVNSQPDLRALEVGFGFSDLVRRSSEAAGDLSPRQRLSR